ncbi:MAG TPA: sensor histidine kinase [Clostridiales bacterium]|nr:sensor histidine kinase [Clostridiales bacterium]
MKKLFEAVNSIHKKIIICFFISSLVPFIILGGLSYQQYEKRIKSNTKTYYDELMSLVSMRISDFYNQLDQYYFSIYNSNMDKHIGKMEEGSIESIEPRLSLNEAITKLRGYYGLEKTISKVYLVSYEGDVIFQTDYGIGSSLSLKENIFYRNFIDSEDKYSTSFPKDNTKAADPKGVNPDNLLYVRKLPGNNYYSGKYTFVVEFSVKSLQSVMSSSDNHNEWGIFNNDKLILDLNNEIFSQEEKAELYHRAEAGEEDFQIKKDRTEYLITSYYLKIPDWRIISVNEIDELSAGIPKLKTFTIIITLISFLISILLGSIFSSMLVKPIIKLKEITFKVKKGDMEVSFPKLPNDEVGDLGKCLESMMDHIRQLIYEKYELSIHEKEAQIDALQSQINPHFLYNTLETISSIAESREVEEISQISLSMAEIYRYSISSPNQLVCLRDEIRYVKNYLEIMKIRWGEKLHLAFHIDDALMDYKIMKLILQPIVENAIYHGIEGLRGPGCLTLSIESIDEMIVIGVQDSGVGIPAEILERINKETIEKESINQIENNSHIGICNVYKRLKLRMGDRCRLEISSEVGVGTRVNIVIPKIS